MDAVNTKLGTRLKELRGETPLNVIEQKTGLDRGNLRKYELGLHLPTKPVLCKLSDYYGVLYEDLRVLYYEDYYARHSEEAAIVLKWAKTKQAE